MVDKVRWPCFDCGYSCYAQLYPKRVWLCAVLGSSGGCGFEWKCARNRGKSVTGSVADFFAFGAVQFGRGGQGGGVLHRYGVVW